LNGILSHLDLKPEGLKTILYLNVKEQKSTSEFFLSDFSDEKSEMGGSEEGYYSKPLFSSRVKNKLF
jgi:hypothetical protein